MGWSHPNKASLKGNRCRLNINLDQIHLFAMLVSQSLRLSSSQLILRHSLVHVSIEMPDCDAGIFFFHLSLMPLY